ncbi:MAG: hypothetical protein GY810_29990 [Aureispira sp.]|nr:hypothetical protein [Aureispira sp.]
MQRRNFIKNSLLTSLGLALGPSMLLAKVEDSRIQTFDIPKAKEHIRHGLFQMNSTQLLNKDLKIQRDVFFNAKEGDLVHFSIQLDGVLLNLGIEKAKVYITSALGVRACDFSKQKQFEIELTPKLSAKLMKFDAQKGTIATVYSKEHIAIPLRGAITINGRDLDSDKGLYLNNTEKLSIENTSDALLLLLSKQT